LGGKNENGKIYLRNKKKVSSTEKSLLGKDDGVEKTKTTKRRGG